MRQPQGFGAIPPSPPASAPKRNRRAGRGKPKARVDIPLVLALLISAVALCAAIVWNASANASLTALREERAQAAESYARLVARHTVRYRDEIERCAADNGVHPAFVAAVILRESSYDTNAVSSAGARGLMQLMEDTAGWIADKLGASAFTFDDAFKPDVNIRFGTWYLKYLSDMFGGDPVKIACAYHAGQSNVKLWEMNHAGEDGVFTLEDIPMADTKDYAQKVVNAYVIYYENFYPDTPR